MCVGKELVTFLKKKKKEKEGEFYGLLIYNFPSGLDHHFQFLLNFCIYFNKPIHSTIPYSHSLSINFGTRVLKGVLKAS